MISLIYKAIPPLEGEFSDLSPEILKQRAENAWYVLTLLDQLPGQSTEQQLDISQLQFWIDKVREECTRRNRKVKGDIYIGKLLSYSPLGSDGIWAHEAVRELLEHYASRDIEHGIELQRLNQRGVTRRNLGEGGRQERDLAEEYEQEAKALRLISPRTAAILSRISE
jgi:hypothetical protein